MRVIVTGGAGFIGSNLCRELTSRGYEVICVDNLGSGSAENIKDLKADRNFKFINQDITKPIKVAGKIDQIYHLASRASPVDYQNYPVETALSNSFGTWNMIQLAVEKKAKLLFSNPIFLTSFGPYQIISAKFPNPAPKKFKSFVAKTAAIE